MLKLMKSGTGEEGYDWFVTLCCRAFLALRDRTETLIVPIDSMLPSELECFAPTSAGDVANRLAPEMSEVDAVSFIVCFA